MKKLNEFQDLSVWQKSHNFVLEIYKLSKSFPTEEKFGLIQQMRRAAVSIPANIAEGFKRKGIKDKIHFYNIAQGSLQELRYYLILGKDLKYISDSNLLWSSTDEIGKMLNGLIKSIGRR
ncbi:MAG: four helix bundle protein [Candidatus Omnitrophota bacterium]